MNHGIKLADGTFFEGSIGQSGNRIELTLTNEVAAAHILDLMDPEKTKHIEFYVNILVAEYDGYDFLYMQRDSKSGRVNVWMEKGEA